jgi:hypothetical protein
MDATTEKYFRLEPNGYSITFPEPNDEQLKIIEKLVGKDITLEEYIEKVYPELLKDVPENVRINFIQQKSFGLAKKLLAMQLKKR